MTATSVKDMGSMMSAFSVSQGNNAKNVSQSGFQEIWSSQSGKNKLDSGARSRENQNTVEKTAGESLKTKEDLTVRSDRAKVHEAKDTASADKVSGEGMAADNLSEEELREAMEILGTAADGMMQQLAEILNVSVEEVQEAMQELDMDSLDVLNQGQLGELFLKVSGAEDSYALVTDETLYNSYQELMGQLEGMQQALSTELKLEPEQFAEILQKLQQPMNTEMQTEEPDIQVMDLRADESPEQPEQPQGENPLTAETENLKPEEKSITGDEGQQKDDGQKHQPDKGEQTNLFAQNLKADPSQPQVQQAAQTSSVWNADSQDIMRQIMDYMRIQLKPEMSNVEMQLHPENLGTLQIQVASKGGVVTANFVTQNETVKAVLESQMVQLQQNFEEQGIKVNAIEVTVQSQQFERNMEQGKGSGQNQEPGKRNRTRRINLNDALPVEDMEQEDALAAEMMAAGGNTVDYTA